LKINNMDKLFYSDPFLQKRYTYKELLEALNNSEVLPKVIYSQNYFEIFKNLILSLIHDQPLTIIDYDFTENELQKIGINHDELKKKRILSSVDPIDLVTMSECKEKLNNWSLTLFTSGTTGIPKKYTHSFVSLSKTLKINSKHKDDIWGFAYNPTHIAGIQLFFQALFNFNSIIRLFGIPNNAIIRLIEEREINRISATPTFYNLLLTNKQFPKVLSITSGGEKLSEKRAQELRNIFPNARINNIYAATEFGSLLVSKDNLFEINSQNDSYLKIVDDELYVKKDFVAKASLETFKNEWFKTGDKVRIVSQNPLKFEFTAREDEIINVGGYKVVPSEIEEVGLKYRNVKEVLAYGKKNSVLGEIVCCDVVIERSKMDFNVSGLRKYFAENLQEFKVPRLIKIVDNIPKTRSGKIKRL